MMETTDFHEVWKNEQVRAFIHRCARRYSKRDPIFWQDLVEEGWIGISKADPQRTPIFYCRCAARAVEAAYRRDYRFQKREDDALERLLRKIESAET
jgi:hypothetical protein